MKLSMCRVPLVYLAGILVFPLTVVSSQILIPTQDVSQFPETVSIGTPVRIVAFGIPLTLLTLDTSSGNALAFRVKAVDDAGSATGMLVKATAGVPFSPATPDASATGMTVESIAGGPLAQGPQALGIDCWAGSDDTALGMSVFAAGDTAIGLSCGASGVFQGAAIGIVASGDTAIVCHGDLDVIGSKNFVQPHPNDPSRAIAFVCLEGNESGTYFRGSAYLANGVAEIVIPEEWALVTAEDGITVQVTPVGKASTLYVARQSRTGIVVRGEPDCRFNYFVNGVRRGFTSHEPYRENRSFRPEIKGIPFGEQYPEELRRILVQNGILNADYTPNEYTAAALGWQLDDPESVPLARRWWLTPSERRQLLEERGSDD